MNTIQQCLASVIFRKERKKLLFEIRAHIAGKSKRYQAGCFTEIHTPEAFEDGSKNTKIIKVLRDNKYLVQIASENGTTRITVNRVEIDDNGDWLQGISWDDLMTIKRLVGYGDFDAVEVYPRDKDIVNVANMRHLFILNESLDFIWRTK